MERNHTETWDDLKATFKQTYWNRYVQQGVRDLIDTGKYEEETAKGSRLQYAYELLAKSKLLEPRIQEELLVNKLCMHFGNRFYNCSINHGTETVTQLIHLIQRLETKGIWKKTKDAITENLMKKNEAEIASPQLASPQLLMKV
jgi:hypothetical protein